MGNFQQKYIAAVILAVVLFALTAILALDPHELGIPPVAAHWLAVLAAVIGFCQSFLPRVSKPGEPLASDVGYSPASAQDIHLLHAAAATVDVVPPLVPTPISAPPGTAA